MPASLHRTIALCVTLAAAVNLPAQTALPKESPFTRPGDTAAAPAASETIEFAGVSLIGSKTDLVFYDKAAKKSRWVPLGETVAGISALTYDSEREQAEVRINGTRKTLTLRKTRPAQEGSQPRQPTPPAIAAAAHTPGVTPFPPAAEPVLTVVPEAAPAATTPDVAIPTPESKARAETEARMLVSDLLEIGIAQRQAYEDAQRKAAEAGKAEPSH